jgi:hypothetical protein
VEGSEIESAPSLTQWTKETSLEWTRQALTLAEGTSELLKEMQQTGKLVQSFKRSSSIPFQILKVSPLVILLSCIIECAHFWTDVGDPHAGGA